jgi:hypothetical protein
MASQTTYFDAGNAAVWAKRLAAEDWSWVTWKFVMGGAALVFLWFFLILTLIMLIVPNTRRMITFNNGHFDVKTFISALFFTWLSGTFAHAAMFGSGPYSYWIHQLVGDTTFESIADWSFRYLTLLGVLFS